MTTLVIADHDNGLLKSATLNTVTAALAIGQPVHVLVAGDGVENLAQAASRVAGVQKVLVASAPQLGHQLAEDVAVIDGTRTVAMHRDRIAIGRGRGLRRRGSGEQRGGGRRDQKFGCPFHGFSSACCGMMAYCPSKE